MHMMPGWLAFGAPPTLCSLPCMLLFCFACPAPTPPLL